MRFYKRNADSKTLLSIKTGLGVGKIIGANSTFWYFDNTHFPVKMDTFCYRLYWL